MKPEGGKKGHPFFQFMCKRYLPSQSSSGVQWRIQGKGPGGK